MGLPDYTEVWDGAIGGVELNTAAWLWLNPRDLIAPPPKRGSNLVVPRGDGEVPLPRRLAARTVGLRFVFAGEVDPDGDPHDSPEAGLIRNLTGFANGVGYYSDSVTRWIWVTDPDGDTWAGSCQLLDFTWGDADVSQVTSRAVLTVHLPQRLEVVAP